MANNTVTSATVKVHHYIRMITELLDGGEVGAEARAAFDDMVMHNLSAAALEEIEGLTRVIAVLRSDIVAERRQLVRRSAT